MPLIGLFRQPIFSISQILLRPIVGKLVSNNTIYSALWSFAGYTITNLGFFKGIFLLFSIKNFIFGRINLTTLNNIVFNYSPFLAVIYNNILKPELQGLRFQNISFQLTIRKLIKYIIINSFLLIFNSIFKLLIKISTIIIFSTLGIFWIGNINNVKYLILAASELNQIIKYYLFIDLPMPKNLHIHNNWITDFFNAFYNIKENLDFKSYFIKENKNVTHIRKISNFEGENLKSNYNDNINDILNESLNSTINLNQNLNNTDKILNYNDSFYIKLLNYLFDEFNLFI